MQTPEAMSRRTLRLPQDATRFLDQMAAENCTSVNAEIVRAVRERMERETKPTAGTSFPAHPAADPSSTAREGDPVTHNPEAADGQR